MPFCAMKLCRLVWQLFATREWHDLAGERLNSRSLNKIAAKATTDSGRLGASTQAPARKPRNQPAKKTATQIAQGAKLRSHARLIAE
jgi:hypothetical protein